LWSEPTYKFHSRVIANDRCCIPASGPMIAFYDWGIGILSVNFTGTDIADIEAKATSFLTLLAGSASLSMSI
jgi:hypothetical protein